MSEISLPPLSLLYFDAAPDRKVDTLDLQRDYPDEALPFFCDLLRRFMQSAAEKEYSGLLDCITRSAVYNQAILALPRFDEYYRLATDMQAGLMVAHSGTIVGLLTRPEQAGPLRERLEQLVNHRHPAPFIWKTIFLHQQTSMPDPLLKPLMFVGTASDVGKSVITTGFCRILLQDGYHPAPFKAQNMSLNSYVTPDGLEIGRAQAVQAEAAGIPCSSDMNPVLLKPTSDRNAQLVLHGRPAGHQSAYEYFMGRDRAALWEEVKTAFDRLARQYHPIVLEGAGSISELNLRERDITNMRMALHAGADVYLIADIDRGGVFASVYGTLALLPPEERALIRGVIINKFRGDGRLFEQGRRQLEDLTGTPVVGVLPYYRDIHIEEEDSVALEQKPHLHRPGAFNIAVIRLPHLANFTDFTWLEKTASLHVFYTIDPAELSYAQMIVLPGSKNTISDLLFLRERGLDQALLQAEAAGLIVVGICGGYQMMGLTVADPFGVEGEPRTVDGLGLLPVHSTIGERENDGPPDLSFRPRSRTGLRRV